MKVIKNQDTYSITLTEKEVETILYSDGYYRMGWLYCQIRTLLSEAQQKGKSDNPLMDNFCFRLKDDGDVK